MLGRRRQVNQRISRKVHKKHMDAAVLIAQEPALVPLYAALHPGEAWVLDSSCFGRALPWRWGERFRRWHLSYEIARKPYPTNAYPGDGPDSFAFRVTATRFPRPATYSWCTTVFNTPFLRPDETVDVEDLLRRRRSAS